MPKRKNVRKKKEIRNNAAKQNKADFEKGSVLLIIVGALICSFGLHNIHQRTGITEGGVLGMVLLVNHWAQIPASAVTFSLDLLCYIMALKYLGVEFIGMSVFSTLCVSGFLKLWEQFPPMMPDLTDLPFLAAVLGGLFIGIGVGLIVRQGGSSGGDDALAIVISKLSGWRLSRSYLFTDVTVLVLSLSYIPFRRIAFSLITVTISSLLIDLIKEWKRAPLNGADKL